MLAPMSRPPSSLIALPPFPILLALCFAVIFSTPSFAEAPPNVVLIMTDDQGWFDLGVHGNTTIETPILDRLAGEGVRFSRYYACPVCTPTRAALMNGRYPQRSGAIDTYQGRDTMDAAEITLGQVFRRRGYRTGIFGKWHLGRYMKYHPNSRGFDEFLGFWQYGFINRYFDSDELFHNRERIAATGYITDVLTDAAIDFIRASRGHPFFLYVPYNAPHSPYLAPDAGVDRYLRKGLPLKEAQIYAMITSIDGNVGRLLKALDDLKLRENTVVIFQTDNGGVSAHFKAGLRGNKGSVYEGGIRVPLFVRWPGRFPAGAVVDAPSHVVDLFPTLCGLIGAPPPDDRVLDGRSLLPLLEKGGGKSPHPYLFHQWTRVRPKPDENWAVHEGKTLKLANGALYDLEADPGETKDLAAERPEDVRRLRGEFEKWFADVTAGRDYGRVPIEAGRDDENPVEIDVTWGEPAGKKVAPRYRNYLRDAVEDWSEAGDAVRWAIDVTRAGRYEVTLTYGCAPEDAGGTYRVAAAGASFDGAARATAGRLVFVPRVVGALDLPAGPATLEIKALTIPGRELMTLHKVWLRRVEEVQ
jgi:arylsulfatase A